LALGHKAVLLLKALFSRPGDVLTKTELMDAAWQGLAVEESNLSVQIGKLRRFIGDERIRTIERVGYRFMPEEVAAATSSAPNMAIAPLAGSEPDAASMAADLITALVPFHSLNVLAGADMTSADYRLEGSIERTGQGLRLAVRLVDMRAGAYRWARRLDFEDSLLERERIAGQIAAMIDNEIELAEIGRWRGGGDVEDCRALYRRAQFHLRTSRPEDYAIATALLERALELEPDNVACLAAMCEALHHRIAMGWPALSRDDSERCLAYARRGLDQPEADGYATALFGTAIYRTSDLDSGFTLMQRGAMVNPI
jgi:DNA-binding winged helix-turn-helix (wHTH) protein